MARIWIADTNPYALPEPPPWWQTLVYGYDKMLRLMPSRKDRIYRLGRLVRRKSRLGLNSMIFHAHPDTQMMIQHGLIPVSAVFPWAIHSTKILRDLKARDTWAVMPNERAADQYFKELDEAEAARDVKLKQTQYEKQDAIDRESFRYIQSLKGERLALGNENRGRNGGTVDTDRTRVKVSGFIPSAAPGGPSGKTGASIPGIVLTDAR